MANVESIVEIALNVKPAEVCLVPEKRQELTTEGGLDVIAHFDAIQQTVQSLSANGTEVSLFIDADEMTIAACKDTGASMVTIPSSTARDLGLVVDTRSPMRKVITAGGVQYAPEVMLSSITVEGWEVNNIKALVLDIPNQPDLGLLGLNYLEQFRMDMNTWGAEG